MRWLTGRQWSWINKGVAWSYFCLHRIKRAAQFRTTWSFAMRYSVGSLYSSAISIIQPTGDKRMDQSLGILHAQILSFTRYITIWKKDAFHMLDTWPSNFIWESKTTPTFLIETEGLIWTPQTFSDDSWGLGQNCDAIRSSLVLSEFSFKYLFSRHPVTDITHAPNLEAVTSSGVLESNEK